MTRPTAHGVFQCTTLQYINSLKVCCDALKEIIAILGPIRVDSEEGANGLKVLMGMGIGVKSVLVLENNFVLHLLQEQRRNKIVLN